MKISSELLWEIIHGSITVGLTIWAIRVSYERKRRIEILGRADCACRTDKASKWIIYLDESNNPQLQAQCGKISISKRALFDTVHTINLTHIVAPPPEFSWRRDIRFDRKQPALSEFTSGERVLVVKAEDNEIGKVYITFTLINIQGKYPTRRMKKKVKVRLPPCK